MVALVFNGEGFHEVPITYNDAGQYIMNGKLVNAFTTTYMSIGGPKAKLMVWVEDETGSYYDNWNTWYAARNMEGAWIDAKSWAQAEEIPAIQGIE
jgi:hypothetical protein